MRWENERVWYVRLWEEAVVAYFKVLFGPEDTTRRIASNLPRLESGTFQMKVKRGNPLSSFVYINGSQVNSVV
jgi:hypothetical protein